MTTQRIELDISSDVFLENLPKSLVRISHKTSNIKLKESQLDRFHTLINNSNNKTKLTMNIATDTSEA